MHSDILYDLTIIGAGPAGMTSGVYAARKNLKTLILTSDVGGQTAWSSGIENYLGYTYITGAELVQKFEEHMMKFDINVQYTRVTDIRYVNEVFRAYTSEGDEYDSRAMIIAAGKSPRLLGVPGEREYTGRGVTYCATCDGPLFSGQDVAVVGGGNSGLDAVVQLMKICPKVYLLENSGSLRADEVMREHAAAAKNVEIVLNTSVVSIGGADFVESIEVRDNLSGKLRTIPAKGVFVEVGLTPNTDFLRNLINLNESGEIVVDCGGKTSIPGLYAAGDVTNVPEKQIIIAAGEGAKAALSAYSYLVRLPNTNFEYAQREEWT
jgi:alkyl hydroperoxide reductase subunit F